MPSRLDAQAEAVSAIFRLKRDSNVENQASLMTSFVGGPKVLATLTSDAGIFGAALNDAKLAGSSARLTPALQVAQLILRNRQNPHQRQRVIVFVGSPLESQEGEGLVKQAMTLKKQGVAVDVIMFGSEQEQNTPLLKTFISAVDSPESDEDSRSSLIGVPVGQHLLEYLKSNLKMTSSSNTVMMDDEELDPELAMALKLSLEEQ